MFEAVAEVFRRVKGAYSVVGMIAGEGMYAFRDPYGIKPIIVGERTDENGKRSWCVASESVLMDLLDFHSTYDLKAGEALFVDMDGNLTRKQITNEAHSPCLFEWVYFARPDSFLDRVSVYKTRLRLGEKMAAIWRKTGWKADVIIPVPESSTHSAMAMARTLRMKYREGLVKNRYIGRTFIMPGQEERAQSVRRKLNAIELEFRGKNVLLVDDSIVRGTTSRQIIRMAREAGARKVYFASAAPPVRYPNVYGIDMPAVSELIAHGRTVEKIEELIGADRLIYQDLHGLIRSVRHDNSDIEQFDTSCFSGNYVTNDVTDDYLRALEEQRSDLAKSKREARYQMPDLSVAEEAGDADTAVGM